MNTLVVPTNRPERLVEFLDAWRPWPWESLVIVEDAPEVSIDVAEARRVGGGGDVSVFSWREIDEALPEPSIISRKDAGIRAFGFWEAWRRGADVIFTLDDDCHPCGDDFVREHLDNLERTPVWQSTVPGLRVRGLPYQNLGALEDVCVSHGLWAGNPDLDAIQTLANSIGPAGPELVLRAPTRVLPSEQYFPLSGMNLAFRREVACLMYFPPMGLNSPYGRFDDIWCGLTLQRICRHLGLRIVCGRPLVEHRRASDPWVNLERESPGVRANERMWELVDAVELSERTPLACMREAGAGLSRDGGGDHYVQSWGRAILEWCELFEDRT